MGVLFEKDEKIRIHAKGTIAQLCAVFRSHEHGLPEWLKNSNTAYVNASAPSEDRVVTILFGSKTPKRYIAVLDHVGMTVEDIETRFSDWGNPEAFKGGVETDEIREGSHGNGGKCYMTQMFEEHSYLHTVRGNRGSKYGFIGDDPNPGYFPSRERGRGFPIGKSVDELRRALAEVSVDFARLPEEVITTASRRDGFTLVVGSGPRNFSHKDAAAKLIESVLNHPQSLLTFQRARVFVVVDGKPVGTMCPLRLPEILPNPDTPEPRIISIPRTLVDPETEAEVLTTSSLDAPEGRLVLRTSKVSMRSAKLRARHHVTYFAYKYPVGALEMEDVGRTYWIERMYGECHLDELRKFETTERRDLANGPLPRAVRAWIKDQVLAYDAEFRKKAQLRASMAQQEDLRKQNEFLNKWLQKSLDEDFAPQAGQNGVGRQRPKPKPRPLPEQLPEAVEVISPFRKAGVGVALPLRVIFRDAKGDRAAGVPYMWYSSDWAVATVDSDFNTVVTHTPGTTSIWIETLDKRLRSNEVIIEVVHAKQIDIAPAEITLEAGKTVDLHATVQDPAGNEHTDVYLTWIQDDSSVVSVTGIGRVIARKAGATAVHACDENYTDERCQSVIIVTPATSAGDGGPGYPKIVLSEFDPDPLNPDGEPWHLQPEDGPVHQPTPQHVEHNVWFVNMTCPLARHYFERYGPSSREWRMYHLERFIEAFVKIKLAKQYQEGEISFDEMERLWRENATEVQARAMEEIAPYLEGAETFETMAV